MVEHEAAHVRDVASGAAADATRFVDGANSCIAGRGLLAIWNDIDPQTRDAFFEWHAREHIPERLTNPGFLRGRRYIAVDADIEFFTLYETSSVEALASPAYMAQARNPSAWSRAVTPGFRNNLRGACNVVFSTGYATGAFVAVLRIACDADGRAPLQHALRTQVLPAIVDEARITGVHYAICDPRLSNAKATAQRTSNLTLPDHVVLIEGSSAAHVRCASTERLGDALLREVGAAGIVRGLYQLEYVASRVGADVPA